MNFGRGRSAGCSFGRLRRGGRIVAVMAGSAAVISLAFAAPAWAGEEATAAIAPIGAGGSYLVTVKNTGTEPLSQFILASVEPATSIAPAPACTAGNSPFNGAIVCITAVAVGASTQMCYSGHTLVELFPGTWGLLNGGAIHTLTQEAAVASCPVSGFSPSTAPAMPGPAATTTTGAPGSGNSGGSGSAKAHHKHKKHHKHHRHKHKKH